MSKKITHIFKAQVGYIRYNLFATLIIIIGIINYTYLRDINPVNILCFLLFVQYATLVLLNSNKEKRECLLNSLTLSSKDLAKTRILLISLGFLVIYGLALLYQFFFFGSKHKFENSLHELFMLGGIGLAGIFLYLLVSDYFSIYKNKTCYIWFNIIISIIIGVFGFAVILTIGNTYESSIFTSSILIFLLYLTAIIFAAMSYNSYQKKESYLGV